MSDAQCPTYCPTLSPSPNPTPDTQVGAAYVARLSERGVAEPMELATLLQRVNSQRVATVQA